jgi:hypothetical protein
LETARNFQRDLVVGRADPYEVYIAPLAAATAGLGSVSGGKAMRLPLYRFQETHSPLAVVA